MTEERAPVPDAQEVERQREFDAAVAQRMQEVSGEHHEQQKGWFRRALSWVGNKIKQAWNWFTGKIKLGAKWIAETTRKIWGSTKRTVKRVWDWSTDKAKRAWSWMKDKAKRTWAWTKVHAKKTWGWLTVNSKKAWSWGKNAWLGANIAGRIGAVAGLGIFGGLIGWPLLMVAGLGTAAFLLVGNTAPAQSAEEKADEAYAATLLSRDVLLLNVDQERELWDLFQGMAEEQREKMAADSLSPAQHSHIVGQKRFVLARVRDKSTASRDAIFEEFKRREGTDFRAYIEAEVKAGMRAAEIKVNKLLRENKVQTTPELP
jgi:hypothetical protein